MIDRGHINGPGRLKHKSRGWCTAALDRQAAMIGYGLAVACGGLLPGLTGWLAVGLGVVMLGLFVVHPRRAAVLACCSSSAPIWARTALATAADTLRCWASQAATSSGRLTLSFTVIPCSRRAAPRSDAG